MLYYLLQREGSALYSMNLVLSEEEARQYGQEGEMVPVKALVVWTDVGTLERFRAFLSVEQEKSHSPFAELIRDMRDEKVDVVALDSVGMRGNLRRALQDAPFLLLNPGPDCSSMAGCVVMACLVLSPAEYRPQLEHASDSRRSL